MRWIMLVSRNLVRRPVRTLVSLGGLALAVAALFSLMSFERGYQEGMRGELDRLGAHILVVPKGCPYDSASMALHGASWPCYLKAEYLTRVRHTAGVDAAAPVLMNAVYNEQTGSSAVYLGVEPDILRLKRGWHIDGRLPTAPDECMLGSSTAVTLHAGRGSSLPLPALGQAHFRVTGVLGRTDGADDGFTFLSLAGAQQVFKRPGQLTHILVRLADPDRLDAVVADLRGCDAGMEMNVVPMAHLFQSIQSLVGSTRVVLGMVAVIALLIAAAGVGNTLLMAVNERSREIGMLRATGASSPQVFAMILLETWVLCTVGALTGVGTAAITARLLEGWLRDRLPFTPIGALMHPDTGLAALCVLAAWVVGAIGALLPAVRAAGLSPIAAMRSVR